MAAPNAAAHTGVLGAMAPFLDEGALVGGSTTWGIVLDDGDGVYSRVCDEAPGMRAWFHLKVGARVLVGGGPGLLATDDRGCSYSARNLAGASDATAAVLAGGSVFVATGRPGYPNGVFRSDDGGLTFVPTGLSGTASPLWNMAASPDGALVVVSGDDLDLDQPLLLASGNGGSSWSSGTVDLSSYARVRVLSVSGAADEVLLGAVEPDEAAWLLVLDAALSEQAKISSPRALTHAVRKDGALFAVADTEALLLRPASGGAFAATAAMVKCLFLIDGVLWACGSTAGPLAGVHFATSSDGLTWTSQLFDADIHERVCAEGTAGAAACVRYQDAGPEPDAGDIDAGMPDGGDAGSVDEDAGAGAGDARDGGTSKVTPPSSPSCGTCANAGSSPALALVSLMLVTLSGPAGYKRRSARSPSSPTDPGKRSRGR